MASLSSRLSPKQIEAEQQHALTGVILQGEGAGEEIVMDLRRAPLQINAVSGELDAERWRNGDFGKTSASHESRITPFSDDAPRRVSP